MINIYYSKMNATPDTVLSKELKHLTGLNNVTVHMHAGGQYVEDKLLNADIVFVTSFNKLRKGMGVGRETETALEKKIPCYVFYKIDRNPPLVRKVIGIEFDQEGDVYLNRYILKLAEFPEPLNTLFSDVKPSSGSDMDEL